MARGAPQPGAGGGSASARGRFAPSPTGDLHLGSAATGLVAWLLARSAGASFVLRVEDIDAPRVVRGMVDRQLDDLRWLGLDWDEGPDVGGPFTPYAQSERTGLYEEAIAALAHRDLVYLCDCSRAEVARVASAPHAGDEGPRYPGLCRAHGMRERAWKRPPAVRLRVPDDALVTVHDRFQGDFTQDVARAVGDFVLRRGDGVWSYQLAVVVDDLAMRIGEVVRAVDLLDSAPRQVLLARLLGGTPPSSAPLPRGTPASSAPLLGGTPASFAPLQGGTPPSYAHVPLVLAHDGTRLAKRARGVPIRDRRAAGQSAASLVAELARLLGFVDAGVNEVTPRELLDAFAASALAGRREVRLPPPLDV